jgi:hypothetical protein
MSNEVRIYGPRVHVLKTWEESFLATLDGKKRFEYRKNDCDYREGDHLLLRLYFHESSYFRRVRDRGFADDVGQHPHRYTWILARVDYVLKEGFGIPNGYAVLSITVLDKGSRVPA